MPDCLLGFQHGFAAQPASSAFFKSMRFFSAAIIIGSTDKKIISGIVLSMESAIHQNAASSTPTATIEHTHSTAPVTFQPMNLRYFIFAVPAESGT